MKKNKIKYEDTKSNVLMFATIFIIMLWGPIQILQTIKDIKIYKDEKEKFIEHEQTFSFNCLKGEAYYLHIDQKLDNKFFNKFCVEIEEKGISRFDKLNKLNHFKKEM